MARRYALLAFLTFVMAVLSGMLPPASDVAAAPSAPATGAGGSAPR
jgi:hypothetical protein